MEDPQWRIIGVGVVYWHELPPPEEASIYDECVRWMRDNLPGETVIADGAGNCCCFWVNRHYPFSLHGGRVGPISGSMGYGLPAAIAQKLAHPDRPAVCLAGDGCLQMTIQEIGTAVQEGLSFPLVVFDNAEYGMIRMHQLRRCEGREHGVRLENPDFGAVAAC